MLGIICTILGAVVGGLGFRVRGGLWGEKIGWGATTARIVAWSVPMTILTFFALSINPVWQVSYYFIPVFVVAWWLGTILGWWKSIDMGRNEGEWLQDFILQTARGIFWVLPVTALLFVLHGFTLSLLILLLGGLSCGVCYEAGWRLANKNSAMGGSEYGEIIFGAAVGIATSLAIILA